ncbi:sodium/proline symporter PutP [Exiguobacterium sp. s193]|uniref:sodium/proline symporter PutP n=1 Tax=Exiguobacterium sp. s193 TaxID=2751207 RepID=UPI001BE5D695|nr:sodium/proline symporter PutP [Exiguobacterium sp. s193]
MSQEWISIGLYLLMMLAIGYIAYKRTTNTEDYMLGGRNLGPGVTALSAGASDMSGWMLMGLPGAMYATGVSALWLALGLLIGCYINYIVLAPRFRLYTEMANDSITIPDFLENRFKDTSRILRTVSAIVIIVFFTFYTSAGIVSGGKLFESSFGFDYHYGMLLTIAVVVAYTLFGGFLAVSWTDFVQGCIMFVALILVPIVALTDVGGVDGAFNYADNLDPTLFDPFKGTTVLGIIGFLAWGLGYFGQPHIIVRFMAIRSVKDLKKARRIGIGWMFFSILGAMLTGLVGIAYFEGQGNGLGDPETVFIRFADVLFHPYITGFLMAAILAAIMSTISSQLLVTSSALTEDFYKTFLHKEASDKQLVLIGRGAVLAIAVIGTFLAWNPSATILSLVGYAWAGFGSAFGPIILLSLYWKRMTKQGALAGIISGAVTVILWVQLNLSDTLYEMVPGFFTSLLFTVIVSLLTKQPVDAVKEEFNDMEEELKEITQ